MPSDRTILLRDGYRCTETRTDRHGHRGRCTVVGSEMVVRDGRAMCSRCARRWDRAAEAKRDAARAVLLGFAANAIPVHRRAAEALWGAAEVDEEFEGRLGAASELRRRREGAGL